jgi:DNA helicase TIP49 (TBP-interacting protein)
MRKFITNSEAETEKVGEDFAAALPGGTVVAMYGDLGAGKTAFVRGMARGMGLSCRVSSPTFTIVNEYLGNRELIHFDMYRLKKLGRAFRHRLGGLSRQRRRVRRGMERERGGRLFRRRDKGRYPQALR